MQKNPQAATSLDVYTEYGLLYSVLIVGSRRKKFTEPKQPAHLTSECAQRCDISRACNRCEPLEIGSCSYLVCEFTRSVGLEAEDSVSSDRGYTVFQSEIWTCMNLLKIYVITFKRTGPIAMSCP